MALIKCPECGNEFSSFAERCPKCGYPTAKIVGKTENTDEVKEKREITFSPNRSSHKKIIGIISGCAIVLIAVLLWFVFAKSDDTAESSEGNIITKVVDKVAPPLSTPDLQLAQVHGNVKKMETKSYISDSNFESKQLDENEISMGASTGTCSFDKKGYFTHGDGNGPKRDAKGYIILEEYTSDGNEEGTEYKNLVVDGKIKTREYKTFGPADTFSGTVTYNTDGNAIKSIDNWGNGTNTCTFEYTKYDKHNNWTQRRVTVDVESDFAGAESGKKYYIEERTIEYY